MVVTHGRIELRLLYLLSYRRFMYLWLQNYEIILKETFIRLTF